MSRTEKRVTLEDAYGEEHEYFMIQIPGRQGMKLINKLMLMLSGGATAMLMDSSQVGVTAASGSAISGLARQVITQGDEQFWMRLLDQVTRDGKKLYGHQANRHFDLAYQGNYGELGWAIYHALEHNFGPSIRAELKNPDSPIAKAYEKITEAMGGDEEDQEEEASTDGPVVH